MIRQTLKEDIQVSDVTGARNFSLRRLDADIVLRNFGRCVERNYDSERSGQHLRAVLLDYGIQLRWTCTRFVPVTYHIKPPWLRTRVG